MTLCMVNIIMINDKSTTLNRFIYTRKSKNIHVHVVIIKTVNTIILKNKFLRTIL